MSVAGEAGEGEPFGWLLTPAETLVPYRYVPCTELANFDVAKCVVPPGIFVKSRQRQNQSSAL
jgi:hypothetical protein